MNLFTFFFCLLLMCLSLKVNSQTTGIVNDSEGNAYKTVRIGNRLWMAENLRVTRFRNGEPITNVPEDSRWMYQATAAWCSYDNDSAQAKQHGNLYNWHAVSDARGICPQGWHIPSDAEWQQLADALGGNAVAGGKLKSTTLWDFPNAGATNASGFNATGTGIRLYTGNYNLMGFCVVFWSSTSGNKLLAWVRYLEYGNSKFTRTYYGKTSGLSCRCVKDE